MRTTRAKPRSRGPTISRAAKGNRAARGRKPSVKLLTYEGKGNQTVDYEDFSGVITDLETMRVPQSDAARAVFEAARQTTGTIKTLAQGRSDTFRMNPYDLYIKPDWNVREMDSPRTLAQIKYLAHDIAKRGVLESYSVHLEDGRFVIDNGHLRQHAVFYAINQLNAVIMTVPVKLGSPGESEQDRVLKMRHTNSGLRLSPWEQGTLMKRCMGWGWDKDKIADEFGCTVNHVNQMFDLQSMPEPLVGHVRTGKITASYAFSALKKSNGNLTKAVTEVESAIRYAGKIGSERVMPKHGRRARAGTDQPTTTTTKASERRDGGQKRLGTIVDILSNATVRADGEGRWQIILPVEDGERLAKLTGMEVPAVA